MGTFNCTKAARTLLLVCAMLCFEETACRDLLSGLAASSASGVVLDRPVL